jgi:Skp family chaperone for outer membrane proteins
MKRIILAALVFLIAPSITNANQEVISYIKQECNLKMPKLFVNARPFFEKLKNSREAFEAELQKSNWTESQVKSLIALYDSGTEGIKTYCDCQSVKAYLSFPDRVKVLAAKVVAGEQLTPEEQQEYLQSVKSTLPKLINTMAQCMK